MTSAASGPGPIRARSVEPVLHLQPRYPVEIPPVAGDEGEVLRKRHPGQPDVLQSKVLPAASQSLEVDLAVRSGKPAESADFLQGGEEGIVSLDGIGRVIGCVGKGFRSMENSPQSLLDECAQRPPIPLSSGAASLGILQIRSEARSPKQIRISNDPRLQTPHQVAGNGGVGSKSKGVVPLCYLGQPKRRSGTSSRKGGVREIIRRALSLTRSGRRIILRV